MTQMRKISEAKRDEMRAAFEEEHACEREK